MEQIVYSVGQFSKLIHKSVRTLQRWDKEGILTAQRTQTGRRYYTQAQYRTCFGIVPAEPAEQKKNICYTRVSGSNQKNDLSNQKAALEQFVIAQGIRVDEWRSDIGSGLNYERKQFNLLLEAVEKNRIAKIMIAHQDRFVRFGYEWFHNDCQRHGCEIVVIHVESLSPEQEVVKDLLTIIHCFSSRLYGLRRYQQELKTMIGDQGANA